jgi:hypothetical protein
MPFIEKDDQETARKYLLGQLADEQQQNFEERLLAEDELVQQLDVTSEELVDEYLAEELTPTESEWFQQHFLASPEGKRSQKFGAALQQYISSHPPEQQKRTWAERLREFWKRPAALRSVAAFAMVVVVVGLFWISRSTGPQSFDTLTLLNSSSTRSGSPEFPRKKLKEDALRITLMLQEPAAPEVRYRAQLMDGSSQTRTLEPLGQDARSVTVEVPASWLVGGHYALTLSTINSDNTSQRIPGTYQFIIE